MNRSELSLLARVSRYLRRAIVSALFYYIAHIRPKLCQNGSSPAYPSLLTADIGQIQQGLEDGTFTSVHLVTAYLARIAQVNPQVHAIVELDPAALAVAADLDAERRRSGPRSHLHGVPVLLKNLICASGLNATAGSYALLGSVCAREASIVTRLREAGAIIVGTSNLSQWGMGRSSTGNSSGGWSAHGGQTIGAFHPRQDPDGSSSGSAVAIALGLSTFTIGTEVEGSLIVPAEKSNAVALKTTAGLVSRDGIVISHRRGTVGPITRTVRDAAIVLGVIGGPSDLDYGGLEVPRHELPNYVQVCDSASLKGARIGIPRNGIYQGSFGDTEPEILEAFEKVVLTLRENGAYVIDNADYPGLDDRLKSSAPRIAGTSDVKRDLEKFFSGLSINPNNVHTIRDLARFTVTHPLEEYPARNIDLFELASEAPSPDSEEVVAAGQKMRDLGGPLGVDGALAAGNVSALIVPSIVAHVMAGLIGYPTVTIPMGVFSDDADTYTSETYNLTWQAPGIPFGVSFVGTALSEATLIKYACALQNYLISNDYLMTWGLSSLPLTGNISHTLQG
ncbi:glutamyl-tRNA amidotransferase subunit A [Xylaria arbuscula]|nr:glutamyl-tRNA amidotransferase subunit A [Xylaria arbuscula]